MRRSWPIGPLLLATLACAGPNGPAPREARFPPPHGPTEAEARLHFLEERLEANRLHAQLWQWGWTGINAATVAGGSVVAARTNDRGDRAANIVQAVQAGIGLVDLWILRPMPGRGAPWTEGPDDPVARLASAERELIAVAQRARDRFDWRVHAGNLALQLAGAGVLLGLDEPGQAALAFGTGMVGGEAFIWSEPWGGERDLEAYRAFVSGGGLPPEPATTLELVPRAGGLALRISW